MDIGATWSWSGNGFKMGTEQRILTEKGTELYKAISTQETAGSTQESTQETNKSTQETKGGHWEIITE